MGSNYFIDLYTMYLKIIQIIGETEALIDFYENDKDGVSSFYGEVEEILVISAKNTLEEARAKKEEILDLIREAFKDLN